MERELATGAQAVDEWRRLEHIAAAAKVKVAIHLRRARRLGASFRTIETATDIPRSTIELICKGPEPAMPARRESA